MNALIVVLLIAVVTLPFALDLYFNAPYASENEEEYIPDGR